MRCSTYGEEEKCVQGLKENFLGVDGRIILKWTFKEK
jgi:hypothetical protein